MFIMLVLALENKEKRNQRGQKEKRREARAMAAGAGLKEKRRMKKIKKVKLGFSKRVAGQGKERDFFFLKIISKLSEQSIHHPPSGELVGAGSQRPSSHACDNAKRTEHTSVDSKDVRTQREFVHLPEPIENS
jgi:hypothetical protein